MRLFDTYINDKNFTPKFRLFEYPNDCLFETKTGIIGLDIFKINNGLDVLLANVVPTRGSVTNHFERMATFIYTLLRVNDMIKKPDSVSWYEIYLNGDESFSEHDYHISKVTLDWQCNEFRNPRWASIPEDKMIFDLSNLNIGKCRRSHATAS